MLKNIYWLLEESFALTRPEKWEELISLYSELINLVGNPKLNHHLVDPRECMCILIDFLRKTDFGVLLCVSKWMPNILKMAFSRASVLNTFHLSRVFNISHAGINTAGHIMNISVDQIKAARNGLNCNMPVLIDDTVVSGGTVTSIWEKWFGKATGVIGCLFAETGAVQRLSQQGRIMGASKVISFPEDDAWHLNDFIVEPASINATFDALEIVAKRGISEFLASSKAPYLAMERVFSRAEIKLLIESGNFVPSVNTQADNYGKNPRLWFRPNFLEQVDLIQILANRVEIEGVITKLNSLITNRVVFDDEAVVKAFLKNN